MIMISHILRQMPQQWTKSTPRWNANVIFYGKRQVKLCLYVFLLFPLGGGIAVGPISISIAEITVGVISSLMVFPANLIVVQMFRLSKPPPDQINWWWRRKKKPGKILVRSEEEEEEKRRGMRGG